MSVMLLCPLLPISSLPHLLDDSGVVVVVAEGGGRSDGAKQYAKHLLLGGKEAAYGAETRHWRRSNETMDTKREPDRVHSATNESQPGR